MAPLLLLPLPHKWTLSLSAADCVSEVRPPPPGPAPKALVNPFKATFRSCIPELVLSGELFGKLVSGSPSFYCRAWNRAPLPAERTSCRTSLKPPGGAAVYGREGPQKSQISFFARLGRTFLVKAVQTVELPGGRKKATLSIQLKILLSSFLPHKWEVIPSHFRLHASLHTPRQPL